MKAFTEQPKHIREGVELPAEELDPFSSNSTSSSITNFAFPPSQPGPSPGGGGGGGCVGGPDPLDPATSTKSSWGM